MAKNKIDSTIADKLRKCPSLNFEGIDFGSVIATEVYDQSLYAHIKHLVKCLLFYFTISTSEENMTKFFIYSLSYADRKDFDEIKEMFLSFFPDYNLVNVNRKKGLNGFCKKVFIIISQYIKFRKEHLPSAFLSSILVAEYLPLLSLYKDHIDWERVRMIGTFCDARCEDNMAAQIAQKYGINTFTLQHGQYRILKPGYEIADAESYKNFISDKLLAWGDATKNEFMKYGISENRIVSVGALKRFSFNHKMDACINNGIFGVILCGDTYQKSNLDMIKIANELANGLKMKFFVRFHPRNNMKYYMKYINRALLDGYSANISNEEYALKVTFSIIHMTGVFVEMLSINSPIFVYEDDYLEDIFKIYPFCFKQISELQQLVIHYLDNLDFLKQEQFKHYHYFNNALNLKDNYQMAIRGLELEK